MGVARIKSSGQLRSVVTRDADGRELARFAPHSRPPSLPHSHPPARGLGDAVEIIAKPIARIIDAVAGTQLAGCGGCARRRAALNRLVPDLRHPFAR